MDNADKRPSEPKVDVTAVRAMLEEVLDTKLSAQDERLIEAFQKVRAKEYEKIRNIFAWIASQFK